MLMMMMVVDDIISMRSLKSDVIIVIMNNIYGSRRSSVNFLELCQLQIGNRSHASSSFQAAANEQHGWSHGWSYYGEPNDG